MLICRQRYVCYEILLSEILVKSCSHICFQEIGKFEHSWGLKKIKAVLFHILQWTEMESSEAQLTYYVDLRFRIHKAKSLNLLFNSYLFGKAREHFNDTFIPHTHLFSSFYHSGSLIQFNPSRFIEYLQCTWFYARYFEWFKMK